MRPGGCRHGNGLRSTLAQGESFTTIGLSINFFRPIWQAQLRAEARVVNRGKNIGYIECEVSDQNGKQVAKASSTASFCEASTQEKGELPSNLRDC